MRRLKLIWSAPWCFFTPILWATVRVGLAAGLLVTILSYLAAAAGMTVFDRQIPLITGGNIGMILALHDVLTILLVAYWVHLVRRLRRSDSPLFPLCVFFLYSVIEPYLLLGAQGPSFFAACRPWSFYVGAPLALAALAVWSVVWGVGRWLMALSEPIYGKNGCV